MESNIALMRMIEELASNAWPGLVQQQLEGWKLRAANGVTRRANSVFTANPTPCYDRWLELITEFYSSRGLPVRFMVSDASPAGLDDKLANLGYEAEAHASVYVAAARDVLERSDSSQYDGAISAIMGDSWLDLFTSMDASRRGKEAIFKQIMLGIGPTKGFAEVSIDRTLVGVGMVVVERGWAGLYDIATHPDHRHMGVGTQIVRSMTNWAASHGATNIYLQVMKNNADAISLYSKLGFSRLYDYHYRSLACEP